MNRPDRGPQALAEQVGHLKSRMGGFVPGSHAVMRGRDLHTELDDMGWVDLYVFGITGRRFSAQQLRLMEAIWAYTSYPDARLWNNRVAALAGTARSTGNLGVSAALAVSEAHIYGRGPGLQACRFLTDTCKRLAAGDSLADCVRDEIDRYGRVAGYGRPLVNADERIAPTMRLACKLGLAAGPHVELAHAVERFLFDSGRNLRMNYGALAAALGADLGLSPQEYYSFMYPAFLAGMQPCYIEAAEKPAGSLFPAPCDGIAYSGMEKRPWKK